MSCYTIFYQDNAKYLRPVESEKEYRCLRDSEKQKHLVAAARKGDQRAKSMLLQMNYSCIPDTKYGPLRGCQNPSSSFAMDIDHVAPEEMAPLAQKILDLKDDLKLLMLEKSARGLGYHLVMERNSHFCHFNNFLIISKI